MEFHKIFSPILIIIFTILVHHHPSILIDLSNSPLFQYKKLQVSTCDKKNQFAQSNVNCVGTRWDLLWHTHIIRNMFLMQSLQSNYESIFHKCSLACFSALENLSTHMKITCCFRCCWKGKVLLLNHVKALKRKGHWSTINWTTMIDTKAQVPK
jgi:hypothetical protein